MGKNIHEAPRSFYLARARVENTLRDIPNTSISEMTTRVSERLKFGHFYISEDKPARPTCLTDFNAVSVKTPELYLAMPVFSMDPDKVLSAPSFLLQADLVRTAAIADSYPENGYDDPPKDVLGRALEVQKTFLEETGSPKIPLDPRYADIDVLSYMMLTAEEEACGIGIDDFADTIRFRYNGDAPINTERLCFIANDPKGFILARQTLIALINKDGVSFLSQLSPEKRTYEVVKTIFELILLSQKSH